MFYDNLKEICNSKNLKITPLVIECGGTKGILSGWKNGASPNSDIVMRLSVRLKVPTDYLLFGKEPAAPPNTADRELLELIENLSPEEIKQAKSFIKYLLSERGSGSSERSEPETSYEAKEEAV